MPSNIHRRSYEESKKKNDNSDTQLTGTLDRGGVVVDDTEDKLFVMSTTFKRLLPNETTFQQTVGALVGTRLISDDQLGRHVNGKHLSIRQRVVDRQALRLKQARGGRPRGLAAPLPHDQGIGVAAHEEGLAVPADEGAARLGPGVVEQVVPDDRVRAQAAVSPVPVPGPVDDGLVAPVLVVVPDAVGKGDGIAAHLQVDGGVGVRDGVGPVQAREEVLVRAYGSV